MSGENQVSREGACLSLELVHYNQLAYANMNTIDVQNTSGTYDIPCLCRYVSGSELIDQTFIK